MINDPIPTKYNILRWMEMKRGEEGKGGEGEKVGKWFGGENPKLNFAGARTFASGNLEPFKKGNTGVNIIFKKIKNNL